MISRALVATELPNSVTGPDVASSFHKFYEKLAIPAESFARAVSFATASPKTWI